MDHELIHTPDKCLLKLKGDFTIQEVGEIRSALLEALKGSEPVEISLEEVTEMDVSSLQLLCSAHRASVVGQKQLSIAGELPAVALRNASAAGFMRKVGCPADTANTCLWLMEKERCKR
jgi:anti-anti-sigma regulatory factor